MDVALTLSFNILADETVVVQGWDHPMYEKIVPQDYAELIELVNSLDSDQILCAVVASQLYQSSDNDTARFYKTCKYNLKAYTNPEDKENYSTLGAMRLTVLTSVFSTTNYLLAIFLREAKYYEE